MTNREILQNAERITISHLYDDGTYLLDVGIAGKAYSIRVAIEDIPNSEYKLPDYDEILGKLDNLTTLKAK